MKIQREGEDDEISFCLRLINIPEAIKNSLISELAHLKIESNRPKKDPTSFVLLIDLNEASFDIPQLKEVLRRHQISDKSYGLWISINSEFDHGGFTLPENVANLYHELRGNLDVSYTIA
jgi:hypothetical protein